MHLELQEDDDISCGQQYPGEVIFDMEVVEREIGGKKSNSRLCINGLWARPLYKFTRPILPTTIS